MKLPGPDDSRNRVDPQITERANVTKSWDRWSVYFRCMLRWDENEMMSIYPRVFQTYTPHRSVHLHYPCISVHPPWLLNNILRGRNRATLSSCTWRSRSSKLRDALGGRDWGSLEMYLEARIEWTQRCILRPWSRMFGDAIADRDWVNSEIHSEAVSERVWKCNWRLGLSESRDELRSCDWARVEMQLAAGTEGDWRLNLRLWLSQLGDALGGRDGGSLETNFEAAIERVWRSNLRARLSELRDQLGGRDHASLDMHLEAGIECTQTCTPTLRGNEFGDALPVSQFGRRRNGTWDSLNWLTCNSENVESWVQQHPLRDGKLSGRVRLSISGWCWTRCMLYSVFTHHYGRER